MNTLQIGDKVQNFTTKDHLGNTISLKDYEGKKLVVFFYPKASTPGCTLEACDLRDHYHELKNKGYSLIGVSADNQKRQKNFADKFELPFPLITDEDKTVIKIFGVWGPKKFQGKEYEGIHRMTFIINEKGLIERLISKVKTKDHAEQILRD